jgi:hypothetical protein
MYRKQISLIAIELFTIRKICCRELLQISMGAILILFVVSGLVGTCQLDA